MPVKQLVHTLHVSSCEVDSFGHVNNAVYLQYCERARNDYMLQVGLKFSDFEEWKAGPVLYRAELDFRRPARVDDELNVTGVIEYSGKTRFRIVHQFLCDDHDGPVCRADLEFAFVNLETGRPCRVPAQFFAAFEVEIA